MKPCFNPVRCSVATLIVLCPIMIRVYLNFTTSWGFFLIVTDYFNNILQIKGKYLFILIIVNKFFFNLLSFLHCILTHKHYSSVSLSIFNEFFFQFF